MLPRYDSRVDRDAGDDLDVPTQVIVGFFVPFASCGLVWLMFNGS